MVSTLTKKDMRTQISEYKSCIHPTKKYRAETSDLLFEMWRLSRRKRLDMWDSLGKISEIASSEKITGTAVKGAFRKFLQHRQNNRCCYCNRIFSNIAHAKPIEHILPRFQYPQFSLSFWNLAIACVDCNLIKMKDVWGAIDKNLSAYPLPLAFFDMYHPRFHVYDEHINYICVEKNGLTVVLYKGLTIQGRNLCLELLDKVAARRILIEGNDELQNAMSDINDYRFKVDSIDSQNLTDFAQMLNDSVMSLLDD
jgi:hypothetical protein